MWKTSVNILSTLGKYPEFQNKGLGGKTFQEKGRKSSDYLINTFICPCQAQVSIYILNIYLPANFLVISPSCWL